MIDVHVDIIDWRGSRGFAGEDACLGTLVAHLAARRQGGAQADEELGYRFLYPSYREGLGALKDDP